MGITINQLCDNERRGQKIQGPKVHKGFLKEDRSTENLYRNTTPNREAELVPKLQSLAPRMRSHPESLKGQNTSCRESRGGYPQRPCALCTVSHAMVSKRQKSSGEGIREHLLTTPSSNRVNLSYSPIERCDRMTNLTQWLSPSSTCTSVLEVPPISIQPIALLFRD